MPKAIELLVTRTITTFASPGTNSPQPTLVVWVCSSGPPTASRFSKTSLSSKPKWVTAMLPQPPTGVEWQLWQLLLLKMGPSPSAALSGVV